MAALLDSGASRNFICASLLDSIGENYMKFWIQPIQFCLADKMVVLSSQVVDLPLVFANGVL